MRRVYLAGVDLSNATMHETDLFDANLLAADLSGADLTGANLEGANLMGAIVTDDQLREARLVCTRMPDGSIYNEESCGENRPPS